MKKLIFILLVICSIQGIAQSLEGRTTLKSHFQTGAIPTQGHFESLINSAYNLVDDSKIDQDSTDNVQSLTISNDTIFMVRYDGTKDTVVLPEGSVTLAAIQAALSNDFHNIGGTDDDVPDTGDLGIIDTEAEFESELFPVTVPAELDYYTDADIDGTESAFTGWDKDASNDFDGTYANLDTAGLKVTASQVNDFDTEVANNSAVTANTAKVSYPGSADATELNILDGATITTSELNFLDNITSNIQDQLGAKVDTGDVVEGEYYTLSQIDSIFSFKLDSLATAIGSPSGITDADSSKYDYTNHKLILYHSTVVDTFNTDGTGSLTSVPPYLTDSLIAWYDMEETSGSTMVDSSGGLNGTISGCTINQTTGESKGYLFTQSSGDYTYVLNNAALSPQATGDFSVMVSCNFSTFPTAQNTLFYKQGEYFSWVDGSGSVHFRVYDNDRTNYIERKTPNSVISTSTDYNIVCIWDGTDYTGIDVYVDGVSQSMTTVSSSSITIATNSTGSLRIGRSTTTADFDGYMSRIIMWKKAVTTTEISYIINNITTHADL